MGRGHSIVGYTLANDVSAWDIERENALYLPQSKVYTRCCALGPVIVTADEIAGSVPPGDDLHHHARRATRFSGEVNTAKLHRQLETLVEYLTRANHVPAGTVLLTGTGIIVHAGGRARPRRHGDHLGAGDRRSYQYGCGRQLAMAHKERLTHI